MENTPKVNSTTTATSPTTVTKAPDVKPASPLIGSTTAKPIGNDVLISSDKVTTRANDYSTVKAHLAKRSKYVTCPKCSKLVRSRGMKAHMRWVHEPEKEKTFNEELVKMRAKHETELTKALDNAGALERMYQEKYKRLLAERKVQLRKLYDDAIWAPNYSDVVKLFE